MLRSVGTSSKTATSQINDEPVEKNKLAIGLGKTNNTSSLLRLQDDTQESTPTSSVKTLLYNSGYKAEQGVADNYSAHSSHNTLPQNAAEIAERPLVPAVKMATTVEEGARSLLNDPQVQDEVATLALMDKLAIVASPLKGDIVPEVPEEHDRDNGLQRLSAQGLTLDGKTIERLDLRQADLNEPQMSGGVFRHALVSGAKITGGLIKQSDLSHSDFGKSIIGSTDFSNSNFDYSNLSYSIWEDNKLAATSLDGIIAYKTSFSHCDLREASFVSAKLTQSNFRGACLKDTKFMGADLTGSDLREVDLDGASFAGAVMDGAKISANNKVDYSGVVDCSGRVDISVLADFYKRLKTIRSIPYQYLGQIKRLTDAELRSLANTPAAKHNVIGDLLFLHFCKVPLSISEMGSRFVNENGALERWLESLDDQEPLPVYADPDSVLDVMASLNSDSWSKPANQGLINKLLYAADQENKDVSRFRDVYRKAIGVSSEMIALLESITDEYANYLFSSDDGESILACDDTLLREINEMLVPSTWCSLRQLGTSTQGQKIIMENRNIGELCQSNTYLHKRYTQLMQLDKLEQVLSVISKEPAFIDVLAPLCYVESHHSASVPFKLIMDLNKAFAPFTQEPILPVAHVDSLVEAFSTSLEDTPQYKARVLLMLSAIFTHLSSSTMLGTQDDSPQPLRNYASSLLVTAISLDDKVIPKEIAANWDKQLTTDKCTTILSSIMRNHLKNTSDQTLKGLYASLYPSAWK